MTQGQENKQSPAQDDPCEFHDSGQAACQQYSDQVPCEPASAQDERAIRLLAELSRAPQEGEKVSRDRMSAIIEVGHDRAAFSARLARRAQTDQQPIGYIRKTDLARLKDEVMWDGKHLSIGVDHPSCWVEDSDDQLAPIYAAPIVQTDPWAPSGADYDRAIHHNPDAKAWADLFVDTFPGLADKHGLMIGWFANAMMAMHDHLARKNAQQPGQSSPFAITSRSGGGKFSLELQFETLADMQVYRAALAAQGESRE